QAHFILGRPPCSLIAQPSFHDSWNVLGMNGTRRIFNVLLQRKTGIVYPTLIEKINYAVSPHTPGHRGNSVDREANTIFALSQRIFGPLASSNVSSHRQHIVSLESDDLEV